VKLPQSVNRRTHRTFLPATAFCTRGKNHDDEKASAGVGDRARGRRERAGLGAKRWQRTCERFLNDGQRLHHQSIQKGRASSVVVVLNSGERVSVRASRLLYLSSNNALITRMSRDAVEKMRRVK
jgi:hypothetical protein